MKLTILGSGSCRIHQEDRRPSGYLLKTQQKNIIVDTGTGITANMPKTDISTREIDIVINTHRHPDHISDLTSIIQEKVVNSFEEEEKDITLIGPEGHKEYILNRIDHEMVEDLDTIKEKFGFEITIVELSAPEEKRLGEVKLEVTETDHGPEELHCLSVRIEEGNKSITFTGDTDYFENLADFAEETDILITDCSKPDQLKAEGHMTPSECGKIARIANTEKLVLSHLYPEVEKFDIIKQASKEFEGDIVKAEDLMTLEF